ncbi:MAG: sulfatase-like hydrolase/transferase [Victivallales bacterium]|nr:sulfatase-like hydrolase/transferase [Victivallales bacterium]
MSSEKKPNVVFILSDQHNAKVVQHQGHPDVKTPNLDRLSMEGVRFDAAITQNPICTPSRMCFHSGQYAHNHGYYGLGGPKPPLPTMFGHFRRFGYATAAVGKIHCPEYWIEDDTDFFREVSGCSIGGNPEYRAFLQANDGLQAWEESSGRKGVYGQCMDGFPSKQPYRQTSEGWTVTESINFMSKASDAGNPFFIHVSFPKPHSVYCPAQRFWDLYDTEKIHLPPNADYEMVHKAPNLVASRKGYENLDWVEFEPKTYEAGRKRKLHGYLGCISQVDFAVGEIMEWLDSNGLSENTIIVYSSDHGDFATEHGLIEKAPGISSDAITRIPFIWRCPGRFKSGHVSKEIVETVDVSQTLCSLAGIEPMLTSDGKDITPLLKGENREIHNIGVTEFAWSKSVREGDFRMVYYPLEMFAKEYPDGFGELYDLKNDPWEMTNLYFDPQHQDRIRHMQKKLMDWLVTTTRPVSTLATHVAGGWQTYTRLHNTVCMDGKISPDQLRELKNNNYL